MFATADSAYDIEISKPRNKKLWEIDWRVHTYACYPRRLIMSIVMSWRHHEAEESKDEYRRNFKATNKKGSPGSGIVDEEPFRVFYYTALAH